MTSLAPVWFTMLLHMCLRIPHANAKPVPLPLPLPLPLPIALPQAVTDAIAPAAPAPAGCLADLPGSFGIAIMNISSLIGDGGKRVKKKEDNDEKRDGLSYAVSQTGDGQVQAATAPASVLVPVSSPMSVQVQVQTSTPAQVMTVAQVSQIADGQVQGGMQTVELTMMPAETGGSGSGSGGGGGNGRTTYMDTGHGCTTRTATDGRGGEAQATATATAAEEGGASGSAPAATTVPTNANQTTPSSAPPSSPSPSTASPASANTDPSNDVLVACRTNSTLNLTLSDSILTDSAGRTGYIASNYQFQFDNPPQSAALFTSGWSVCGNGSLALGGNAVFWQCLSGEFYNLYDRGWAAQCSMVAVRVVGLVDC